MKQSLPNDDSHKRPANVSDETVAAAGKVSEALEWIERARGDLYEFHQKIGRADQIFGEAADQLSSENHEELAELLRTDVCGRNVLAGRWTFQIVEEFDDGYYTHVKMAEQKVRDNLLDGKRHVFESEMKERLRSNGMSGHEARPSKGE